MTDIHTHILPGVDDGAADPEQSLAMLRMEAEQGVDRVALTPHFYIKRESVQQFLERRQRGWERLVQRLDRLPQQERDELPELYLGAEVAWQSDLLENPELARLCIGKSKYMLVELPFILWTGQTIYQLNELMSCHGITPVIAHLERYLDGQSPRIIQKLLELDIPVQISCGVFGKYWTRRKALNMLRRGQADLLATDCHNCDTRRPDLEQAVRRVSRALGQEAAERILENSDLLLG